MQVVWPTSSAILWVFAASNTDDETFRRLAAINTVLFSFVAVMTWIRWRRQQHEDAAESAATRAPART